METPIPRFYRIFFTWVDPLIALSGCYFDFFDRDTAILAFIPDSVRNPDHDAIFYQKGGLMLSILFLQLVLLRYTSDVGVWKIFQTAIVLSDFAMIAGQVNALLGQGRLLPLELWRDEEIASMAIVLVVTVMRCLFVAGVGLRGSSSSTSSNDSKGKAE